MAKTPGKKGVRRPKAEAPAKTPDPGEIAVLPPPPDPEFEKRVHKFVGWALSGLSAYELKTLAEEKLSETPVAQLFAAAEKHFASAAAADPDIVRGFCIEAYRDLYHRALVWGDFSTALKCLQKLERSSLGK